AVKYGQEQGDPFLGRSAGRQPDYSLEVAHEIDEEVRALIEAAHTEAWEILNTYRDILDVLVVELLDRETLQRKDLERIFDRVEKRPRITAFNDFGGRTPSDKPPIKTPGELAKERGEPWPPARPEPQPTPVGAVPGAGDLPGGPPHGGTGYPGPNGAVPYPPAYPGGDANGGPGGYPAPGPQPGPQQGGYPPQQGGYPPQQGGYPHTRQYPAPQRGPSTPPLGPGGQPGYGPPPQGSPNGPPNQGPPNYGAPPGWRPATEPQAPVWQPARPAGQPPQSAGPGGQAEPSRPADGSDRTGGPNDTRPEDQPTSWFGEDDAERTRSRPPEPGRARESGRAGDSPDGDR
ncbi:MAG: hypothetical protein ACRDRV_01780, partial [Pseudonocardiaceae bacterium]